MSELFKQNSIDLDAEALKERLLAEDYSEQDLSYWLQGFGISHSLQDRESAQFVMEALERISFASVEGEVAKSYLADVLCGVLKQKPDKWLGDSQEDSPENVLLPEALVVNALWLAAYLGKPEKLSEQLYELFRRQYNGETPLLRELFRGALIDALIVNQCDDRLLGFFKELASNNGASNDGRFRCHPNDCYLALLNIADILVPSLESSEERHHVLMHLILSPFDDKTNDLQRHPLRSFSDVFLGNSIQTGDMHVPQSAIPYPTQSFLALSAKNNWPAWAVESFPGKLVFPLGNDEMIVWSGGADLIPDEYVEKREDTGVQSIVKVKIASSCTPEVREEIRMLTSGADKYRRGFREISDDVFSGNYYEFLNFSSDDSKYSSKTRSKIVETKNRKFRTLFADGL